MNSYIKLSKLFLCMAGCTLFVLTACKKDNNGAAPVINSVRALDSTKRDSTFTQALPGSIVVVQGANFSGLQAVFFNNTNANVNVALASTTKITVTIPTTAPTEATDPNVPSTLKVVTDHGTATYKFVLLAPPPAINAISN